MAGTVTTRDLSYDLGGNLIREVVTVRDIANSRPATAFTPVAADRLDFRVHVTHDSDAWREADRVENAIAAVLRGARYRGVEVKITRE